MNTAGVLMTQSWQGLKSHDIAICSLIHFYVHEMPLNEPSPMLARLLAYTARLIFHIDVPSSDLSQFSELLSSVLEEDRAESQVASRWIRSVESLILSCNTFSGLHAFFTKVERLLMTEELYDEVQGITVKPAERQIDEQSPFGHFLQRCLDDYLGLEDNEFARLVGDVQRWISGEGGSEYEDDADVMRNTGSSSLKRGDYALARSELEGFFDRSPNDAMHLSLQDALYRNAVFHHQTRAFEAAKASLEEALRLSRGANDMAIVSSCDKLLRLIKYEEGKLKGCTSRRQQFPDTRILSSDELWQVESDLDQGRPTFSTLSDLQSLSRPVKGKESDKEMSLAQYAEIQTWQARIWSNVDNVLNAKACNDACREFTFAMDQESSERIQSQLSMLESDHWNPSLCSLEKRFSRLFDADLIRGLDMFSFERWQMSVWKLCKDAGIGSEGQEVVAERLWRDASQWTHVEEKEEDITSIGDEATFGDAKVISFHTKLMNKLSEAKRIRQDGDDCSTSLAIAVKVLRQSEEAQLVEVMKEATLECATSLLGLGNSSKAREVLDGSMTIYLASSNSAFVGRATWTYAKILIKLSHEERGDMRDVLPWLHRARSAFEECHHLEELSEVLYVQWKLFESLGMALQMQEAERDLLSVQKQITSTRDRNQRLLQVFQDVVAQVGARVMAGG